MPPTFPTARPLSALEAEQAQALADVLSSRHEQGTPLRVRRQRSGRFDPRSAMRAERDPDDVRLFAKAERTTEPEPLAVAAIVDLSVSMSIRNTDRQAVSATAVLCEAVRLAEGTCAVVAFAETAWLVKPYDAPTLPRFAPVGWRSSNGAPAAERLAREAYGARAEGYGARNGPLTVTFGDGQRLPTPRSGWTVAFEAEGSRTATPLRWGESAVPALIAFFTQEVA
jgi:hypothetical protein